LGGSKLAAQSKAGSLVFDSLKAIKEIAAQNLWYSNALARSDSAGVANSYTEDARIINNGSPSTIGRTAIAHFYGQMIRGGITGFGFETTGVWGSDNNLVVEDGTLFFALTNGTVVVRGRYLLVWKREHGVLKIFRDTLAADGKVKN